MKKLEGRNLTLYDRIEELEKDRGWKDDIFLSQVSRPSQDALSLCNNLSNLRDRNGTASVPQVSQRKEPDQASLPEVPEGAELISRNLQYLAGIDEDLTGWTLWWRSDVLCPARFATDPAGVIRWERWYKLEPRVIIETSK